MKAILFDMDGVVYNSETAIPGASEALAWVRTQGIPHLFVTNTTSRGRLVLVEKLARFGIPADERQILTPCVAAAAWLREELRQWGPRGVAVFVPPKAAGEFAGIPCLPEQAETGAHYVVIGDLGERWDFRTLNRAFRLLRANPDAVPIALGMTRFWQAEDGIALDVAPFVAALEHATGRKALVFGKPAARFFHAAAEQLQVAAEDILMVGDDIATDIGGAQQAGMRGALVKTGKFRPADLAGEVKPDVVLNSVADLPAFCRERFY
jgi:phospholysine phosphohistidine inorganic pyrophosphate phosphatase